MPAKKAKHLICPGHTPILAAFRLSAPVASTYDPFPVMLFRVAFALNDGEQEHAEVELSLRSEGRHSGHAALGIAGTEKTLGLRTFVRLSEHSSEPWRD